MACPITYRVIANNSAGARQEMRFAGLMFDIDICLEGAWGRLKLYICGLSRICELVHNLAAGRQGVENADWVIREVSQELRITS